MSPNRLAYGESPYAYLMMRRIEQAVALLGTFSTRFTELVGMPSSTYGGQTARATAGMPSLRGETGDQTDQESRSAGHSAAPIVTATDTPGTATRPGSIDASSLLTPLYNYLQLKEVIRDSRNALARLPGE